MPRTAQEILRQADHLAKHFEDHEPKTDNVHDAKTLARVRQAFQRRAESEQELAEAVRLAREDGQSWSAIGAMLGTSGEAARQRYGVSTAKR
jgi:Flp pilus assembly protein TadD